MNATTPVPSPAPKRGATDIRLALVFAALMLAILPAASLAARLGVADVRELKQRALMVVIATYLTLIGNDIPKRITSLTARGVSPERVQSFYRFAGWMWVLAALGLGLAWIALPVRMAGLATLTLMPLAMIGTVVGGFVLRSGHSNPEAGS